MGFHRPISTASIFWSPHQHLQLVVILMIVLVDSISCWKNVRLKPQMTWSQSGTLSNAKCSSLTTSTQSSSTRCPLSSLTASGGHHTRVLAMDVPFISSGAQSRAHYALVRKVETATSTPQADQYLMAEVKSIRIRLRQPGLSLVGSSLLNKLKRTDQLA